MKRFAMRVRTSLSLSVAAMSLVALIALALSLASVLYMAHEQKQLTQRYYHLTALGHDVQYHLHQYLGSVQGSAEQIESHTALLMMFAHIKALPGNTALVSAIDDVQVQFARYALAREQLGGEAHNITGKEALQQSMVNLRESLLTLHHKSLLRLENKARQATQHSMLFALLLTLAALLVLTAGAFAVRNMTRRITGPIEAFTRCADQLGDGDFAIELPQSNIYEFRVLRERVEHMAAALRAFKDSDVQALHAGQKRLQAVLDSIDDGLLILDLNGAVEHLNPIALRQLNGQRDSIGKTFGQLLNQPELDEQVQSILQGAHLSQVLPDLCVRNEDTERFLAYSITPITLLDGSIHGAVIVLRDVTQERVFEKLRHNFVQRAAHELRTPVTGINMAFGLLRERLKFAPQSREHDLIHTVESEMQRLLALIGDLLNFSRYQNSLQMLNPAPCNVTELLKQAAEQLAPKAQARALKVDLDIPKALPEIEIDAELISRVLDNLLSNAIRHSHPDGQITLKVRQHGERVIVSVEDQGEGIAFGQQARIFEPFVQASPKKGGFGLGLALCKEIVQLHGGRIGVYSKPGQGTQFYFSLPLKLAPAS